ncbi:hypothetical protein [Burkholderia gladioli]|nr:hypothetical protein [Burkholderia gladioli]
MSSPLYHVHGLIGPAILSRQFPSLDISPPAGLRDRSAGSFIVQP